MDLRSMSRKVLFRVTEQVEIIGSHLGIAAHGLFSDLLIGLGRFTLGAILIFALTLLTDVSIFNFFIIDEALCVYIILLVYLRRVVPN